MQLNPSIKPQWSLNNSYGKVFLDNSYKNEEQKSRKSL